MSNPEITKILVVEDNWDNREFIQNLSLLTENPSQMELVPTLDDAREAMSRESFDLAILVYRGEYGPVLDVVEKISPVPIILLTEPGHEQEVAAALGRGVYEYLILQSGLSDLKLLPGLIRNALARIYAEESLRESEKQYQDLYDNAPDMYFILNTDGSVRSVNLQGAEQLGYTVEDLVGKPVSLVVHPEDWPSVELQVETMLKAPDEVYNVEFRKIKKDGSVMYVAERITVHQSKDVVADISIRIICRDVTEARSLRLREAELQERLARSERLETVAVLAGGVAHDLNNILGPVVGYPELLMEHFDPGSREYRDLAEIQASAGRAVDVIRDLLTLSRRGQQRLEAGHLNEFIHQYVNSGSHHALQGRFPEVTLTMNLDENLPPIDASVSQLNKMLMNLVMNAYEAIHDQGTVAVRTYQAVIDETSIRFDPIEEGAYVILEVKDDGPGIPKVDQERIFEPFYTRNKFNYSGTGLGLAVVYGVLKDHNGFVDLSSEVGKGTCFKFYFPLAKSSPKTKTYIEQDKLIAQGRVLVIDDVPEQRKIARRFLENMGLDVDDVSNGSQAIAKVKELKTNDETYDLLLMDMIMEEHLDGLDTYKKILELVPGQKCVIVSGYAKTGRVGDALTLGAEDYIRKPYTRQRLGQAVIKAMSDEG